MPKQEQPVTHRPTVEDESVGNGSERHGKHREDDEALPGKGSTKGGMNKDSGRDRGGASTKGPQQSPERGPGFREER